MFFLSYACLFHLEGREGRRHGKLVKYFGEKDRVSQSGPTPCLLRKRGAGLLFLKKRRIFSSPQWWRLRFPTGFAVNSSHLSVCNQTASDHLSCTGSVSPKSMRKTGWKGKKKRRYRPYNRAWICEDGAKSCPVGFASFFPPSKHLASCSKLSWAIWGASPMFSLHRENWFQDRIGLFPPQKKSVVWLKMPPSDEWTRILK